MTRASPTCRSGAADGRAPQPTSPARPGAIAPLHRPARRRGAGRGRAAGAGRHRDRPRGRGPGRRAALLPAGRRRRGVPGLGDPPARAAQPAQRHRRPPAGGAAPAGPPGRGTVGTGRVAVVVAPVRAVLQPLVRGLGDLEPVGLQVGDEMPLEEIVERLVAAAYVRTDLVERRGEFAVRGGILDVFPPTEEHPLRVELFGDTVEEIRWFAVADQRSLQVAPDGLWAPPCREVLLTDAVRARAAELAPRLPGVADLLAKVAEGIAVEGMESLAPVLVDGMEPLLDVLPRGLPGGRLRPRAGAHPGPRPGRDERGVPAGQLGQRGGGQHPAGRPAAGARHRVVLDAGPDCATTRRSTPCRGGRSGRSAPTPSWPTTAEAGLVSARPAAGGELPRRDRAGHRRPRRLAARRLAGRRGDRGLRPGQAGRRAARRARAGGAGRAGRAARPRPSPAWCTP